MYIWANLDSAEESFQSKAAEKKDILYIIQIVQCSLVIIGGHWQLHKSRNIV